MIRVRTLAEHLSKKFGGDTWIGKPMRDPIAIKPRKCSCGLEHREIPTNAKWSSEDAVPPGVYWNCVCQSTIVIAYEYLDDELIDEHATFLGAG